MPKSRPPYLPEVRRRLVRLVRAGRSAVELTEEFEPSRKVVDGAVATRELAALAGPAGHSIRHPGDGDGAAPAHAMAPSRSSYANAFTSAFTKCSPR